MPHSKRLDFPEQEHAGTSGGQTYPHFRTGAKRIRVLHSVGHLLRGGIETWLYQVVKKLDPAAFEHHVLVRTEEWEAFTKTFIQAGVRVLPCVAYTNPLKYVVNLRRVVRQNGPYDILHVHGSNPNGLQACILAKRLGIPHTIVHSHNDVRPLIRNRSRYYRAYVKLNMKLLRSFADGGLAASTLAAESMFGDNWQKDPRWQILFYGIDFTPFSQPPDRGMRRGLGIPEDAFVVGHVGRFHEQKNHAFLTEIAKATVEKNPKAHFLFIGEGDLRPQITARFQQHGLAGHATFVPDTAEVARFFQIMNCFVFPSRYEGLGLVAVEAQAADLACFISDRVPREAIVDPKLVRVLKLEDSPSRWAEEILEHSKVTRTTGKRDHLDLMERSKFNIDQNISRLAAQYQALAGSEAK